MIYTDGIHIVGDTLTELHNFAERVGIGRHWFHGTRKGHPHYDKPARRDTSSLVNAGATLLGKREIAFLARGTKDE